MTGKELIMYIIKNDLLNEPIFSDNKILGLVTVEEAAIRLDVGKATISVYAKLGRIDSVKIGNAIFIVDNDKLKTIKERIDNEC